MALAADLSAVAQLLGVDEGTVRTVLNAWGPGKFDAELLLDGKGLRPVPMAHRQRCLSRPPLASPA